MHPALRIVIIATLIFNTRAASADDSDSQIEAEYREIQALYGGGAYEADLKKISVFQVKHPGHALVCQTYNLQGLIHLLKKRLPLAVTAFRQAISTSKSDSFKMYVRYNLATALFESGSIAEAGQTLISVDEHQLDRDNQAKFFTLRGRVHQKQNQNVEASRDYLRASQGVESSETRKVLATALDSSLGAVNEVPPLAALVEEQKSAPIADLLLDRLGRLELKAGHSAQAEVYFKKLTLDFPHSTHYSEAAEFLRGVQSQAAVEPKAIGVLLPMSGKFSAYGQQALQAIELAFKIFNLNDSPSPVTLVIEDTGEDTETAIRGLDQLYLKFHVAAVIGPLMSKGISEITQHAQDLGVPLVTLAQQSGVQGESIFQSGLTPRIQAEAITRYAIEKLKLKRIAILYPRDKFGDQFSQAAWDAVEMMGGSITGFESYSPGETDFRQSVDRLSGMHYLDARERETEALAELRKAEGIKKRTRKTEQYFNLKPIVDYDAVFIPDEPKVVGQILPTFAYRDVTGIQFLGIATWNSPDLIARAQSWAEGALFCDAFFGDSSSPLVKKFVAKYRETFSQDPGAIEALAYDAAQLVDFAVKGGADSRSQIRDRFRSIVDFPGVTGKISYRDGVFARTAQILTVRSSQVVEAKMTQ